MTLCALTIALSAESAPRRSQTLPTYPSTAIQEQHKSALTPEELELWKRFKTDDPLLGVHNYRDGIPIIAKTVLITSLDVAIANALEQCNALRGIFTIRPDLTSESFDDEVHFAYEKLGPTRRKPSEYEVATRLLQLNEERYNKYRDATKDLYVPNSRGGYLALLVSKVRQHKTEPATLTTLLKDFVRQYQHKLEITSISAEFGALQKAIDQRSLLVVLGPTENDAVTVAGYFVYNSKPYLIVHDPTSATVYSPQDDPLFLQDRVSTHSPTPPPGVRISQAVRYAGRNALVIGKAEFDLDVLRKSF